MAIPDGKPATDFSAMNREWVRAVAEEAGESALPSVSGSDNGKVLTVVTGEWAAATPAAPGIPAPASPSDGDVLTYDGTTSAWVAEEYPGYDIVIKIDLDTADDNGTIIKGSYNDIHAKVTTGKTWNALVFYDAPWEEDSIKYPWGQKYLVVDNGWKYEMEGDLPYITICSFYGFVGEIAVTTDGTSVSGVQNGVLKADKAATLYIADDNTITRSDLIGNL